MNGHEALRMMITTALGALVSCRKNPQSVVENPTKAAPTSTTSPSPTASPTETQRPDPTATETQTPIGWKLPKVYMTRDISADELMKIYNALTRNAQGNVAVKISSGERISAGAPHPPGGVQQQFTAF